MQICPDTTIQEVRAKKDGNAIHVIHEHLCKKGPKKFCCATSGITIKEAAKMVGITEEKITPLIEKLNEVPDKN